MFSGPQVCALTGITYRQLQSWCSLGVLNPVNEGGANPGTGSPREFTIDELFVVTVVADVMRLGMSTTAASRLASWLRMETAHCSLFVDVDGYVLNEPVGSCYIVDVDELREALDARVAEITTSSR